MTKVCTPYCKPCIYARWNAHGNGNLTCDYIGVTGHSRGCKPGDEGVVRVVGERNAPVETMIFKGRKVP